MKKIICSILSAAIIVGLVSSCKKTDELTNLNAKTLNFESFEKYGKIHNDFLTNVKHNFHASDEICSYDEAIEYIDGFQQEFLRSTNLSHEEKQMLSISLSESKRLVDFDYSYNKLFPSQENRQKSTSIDEMSLFELIEKSKEDGLIDDFEYNSLLALGKQVKLSYEGSVSDEELRNYTIQLKDEWLAKGYTLESENGKIMAYTLAISLASIEWWEENPDGLKSSRSLKSTLALPAWAAADIGGAIWGGATGAISSYTVSGGESVSWEAVGIGALSGAISTSTGGAGKLGKWMTTFYKIR